MNQGNLQIGEHALALALQKEQEKEADKARKASEREVREKKREEAILAALAKHSKGDFLTGSDLTTLLRHVQHPQDPKLPSKAEELRALWEERKERLNSAASI